MGLILSGDNRPGFFLDAELAEKLGVNHAIILGRIIWWTEKHIADNDQDFFHDGRWWMYESIPAMQKYSKLSRKQIRRVLDTLRDAEILTSEQLDKSRGEMRNFYSVDAQKLTAVLSQEGIVRKPNYPPQSAERELPPHSAKRELPPHSAKRELPIVPKGNHGSAKRELPIVPKGNHLTYIQAKNQTKTHAKIPAEPPSAESPSACFFSSSSFSPLKFEKSESKISETDKLEETDEIVPSQIDKNTPPVDPKLEGLRQNPSGEERELKATANDFNNITPLPISPRLKTATKYKHSQEDLELAKLWLAFGIRESSWTKPPPSWTEEIFAEGIYKVKTSTRYNGQPLNDLGIREVFKFIESDHFWRTVAWSPIGLLKPNKDGVRKIDNIIRQMKPKSLRQEEIMKSWAPATEEELKNPFGFRSKT